MGSKALLTALTLLTEGTIEWKKQDDFFATYADKIQKGEFFLDPNDLARQAALKVQASSAAHPARCLVASRPVTIVSCRREPSRLLREQLGVAPGRIILHAKKLYLGCFDQLLEVLEIRPDGKRTMSGAEFAAGIQNVKSGLITWEGLHV